MDIQRALIFIILGSIAGILSGFFIGFEGTAGATQFGRWIRIRRGILEAQFAGAARILIFAGGTMLGMFGPIFAVSSPWQGTDHTRQEENRKRPEFILYLVVAAAVAKATNRL